MNYTQELKTALNAVKEASILSKRVQERIDPGEAILKEDRSPVTVADFGCQALIRYVIRSQFPSDGFIAEEEPHILRENQTLLSLVEKYVKMQNNKLTAKKILNLIDSSSHGFGDSKRFWTLDPIDGTKGFLRLEQYAIALALLEEGEVVLGVLGCPNLPLNSNNIKNGIGSLLFAVRGKGTFQADMKGQKSKKISVDLVTDPSSAIFCESVETAHSRHEIHERITSSLGITKQPVRIDSQCKYALVARGEVSIYMRLSRGENYREKIWDHAAGSLIVEEAGGRVTDFSGKKLDFTAGAELINNRGILATNGLIHDRVLEAVLKSMQF